MTQSSTATQQTDKTDLSTAGDSLTSTSARLASDEAAK